MFFAPWCGHCKRLAPVWEELAVKYNQAEEKSVVIAKVDCTKERALCSAQDVTGYPTLKFFKSGFEKEDGEKYRGNRDKDALLSFINKKLGNEEAEEKPKVEESGEVVVKEGLHILTAATFAKTVEAGDTFIKFYAPWCGHCIKLAPAWDELAKVFEKDEQVKIAKIDCTEHQSICQEHNVRGYPTLEYFRSGRKLETYKGARALNDLKDWVNEQKVGAGSATTEDGKVPDAKEEKPSAVLKLEKSNFDEKIKEGVVFVKFFAPWCGHCKRLAPTWEQLAEEFQARDDVTIAHVDCTADNNVNRELCDGQGVNGFPTLLIYKNGVKVDEYNGNRELADLQTFVQKIVTGEKDGEQAEKDEL